MSYDIPYTADSDTSSYNVVFKQDKNTATPFAANLVVADANVLPGSVDTLDDVTGAILFSLDDMQVLYSKNANTQLNPASLTKVMTALVALKSGTPMNQTLIATGAVTITESGAQLCGINPGDTMTLDQALRIMLLYSANDAAMLIADCIGGTPELFIEMMNEEARAIGATNSHFTNPHGLTDVEHYTTPYDLYLMLNEAMKYDVFREIIQMQSYQTTYYDKDGKEKSFEKSTTNLFLREDNNEFKSPSGVTVIGGKTGTTKAAGHCLMLYSKDASGAAYISVVMGAASRDELYAGMIDLLDEINK